MKNYFTCKRILLIIRVVHGLGLCPTWTRPDIIRWGRFQPATNLNEVSDQPSQVVLAFGCESVGFRFSDIAGFWPKSSQI